MGIYNPYQDFADRHYKYFGDRKHFSFLVKTAKKFGISYCDQIIGTMRQLKKIIKKADRIKYFTTVIYKNNVEKKFQDKKPF